jgi:hypothetical protein
VFCHFLCFGQKKSFSRPNQLIFIPSKEALPKSKWKKISAAPPPVYPTTAKATESAKKRAA